MALPSWHINLLQVHIYCCEYKSCAQFLYFVLHIGLSHKPRELPSAPYWIFLNLLVLLQKLANMLISHVDFCWPVFLGAFQSLVASVEWNRILNRHRRLFRIVTWYTCWCNRAVWSSGAAVTLLLAPVLTEQVNLSGKYSDLYSGGARFESRPGNPLSRLRFFVKFLILRGEMPE